MASDSGDLTAVPPPKHPPRPTWRGRDVTDVWMLVVLPVAFVWVLCLATVVASSRGAEAVGAALMFSAVWIPLMWMRARV